ncbi:MAG: toxin-antitoxin system YwqK family antitoxin [Thiohalospira sp.]
MKKIISTIFFLFLVHLIFAQSNIDTIHKEYYHGNGNIASKGYLINDKPDGFWKSYYLTGVKRSEGIWKNGKLDSTWIFYNYTGDTSKIINYKHGKKNGFSYEYYINSNNGCNYIKIKELYLNNKRNGKSFYYYPDDGKLHRIISFSNDLKNGLGYEFDKDSNIIAITRYRNNQVILHEEINRYDKNGNKTGIWKLFYDNGTLKEEKEFLKGKLHGVYKIYNKKGFLINTLYYENGEIIKESDNYTAQIDIKEDYDENGNLLFEGSYLNQKPIGVHRFFNVKGEVIKTKIYNPYHELISEGIVQLDGKREGKWIDYYPEGKKRAEGYYNNGEKTGNWKFYFPNGRIQQTGSYINGKLSGSWKWYYSNGNLRKEEFYIYGLPDGESIEYSDTGSIIGKGNYVQGEKEGKWKYDIGDQIENGNYVMGLKDGIWKRYYKSNGSIAFEGRFLQGSPDGKHTYYFPNGKEKENQYYETGEKVRSWPKYYENGELQLVIQYRNNKIYKINGVKIDLPNNDH